ncbi:MULTISPECIES: antibiotic biosynthesis monooxygenase [unclassified Roseitalea]|uniref:antibiotic biosynthesis monooxygenase family protein n=1 Tax=unclassified Roseitalea TaxID=2639107 RepID=UPI00273D4A0B|nr:MULTISPECIES: antibiotic biosynthesis monooxygenase [unclassified Roseitalea]
MFVAMNRFRINKGHEDAFEEVWRSRDSRLKDVQGFQSFHLLKGAFDEDSQTTLYASHTIWESQEHFSAWTRSEHFRAAHKSARDTTGMYAGPPVFEGFSSVLAE